MGRRWGQSLCLDVLADLLGRHLPVDEEHLEWFGREGLARVISLVGALENRSRLRKWDVHLADAIFKSPKGSTLRSSLSVMSACNSPE